MKRLSIIFILLLFSLLAFSGCSTVQTERSADAADAEIEKIVFPAYEGPSVKVQVLNFSIPPSIAEQYPELGENKVGWGLCNRLIDTFYETGRFEFVEEKEQLRNKIIDNWKLIASGATVADEEFQIGALEVPDYFVYTEVYEFSVRKNETNTTAASEKEMTTILGIQLRLVDVESGKYIPASGLGEASSLASSVWVSPNTEFDQSTVGIATDRAVRAAVLKLLQRI